uniref:Uncharacterized protein n=2 Tax=Cajanus cajan TaxID=3821 RepID=A0A151TYS9_CAJCA|nr:hypothetical protein KK1_004819 [Cajanus cajan]
MGDRNTRYFHGTTVIRRRRNKVERLLNDQALWVMQQEELEAMVTEYYKHLFLESGDHNNLCLQNAFPSLGTAELEVIGRPISDEEILQAIKRMGSFKALGPDGL